MNQETIDAIEKIIKSGKVAEVKQERGNIAVIEIRRKATSKKQMPPSPTEKQ